MVNTNISKHVVPVYKDLDANGKSISNSRLVTAVNDFGIQDLSDNKLREMSDSFCIPGLSSQYKNKTSDNHTITGNT